MTSPDEDEPDHREDEAETWADQMSNEDPEPPKDICDHLLHYFPVPGEIWVHLRTQCNYFSSLLSMYVPPRPGETPCVINGWRAMHKVSPYRVHYGTHNPAMHGLILTSDSVVPNFSWTPRLALESEAMEMLLQCPFPLDILVLPAVTCAVVRVFYHDQHWYVATNRAIEQVPVDRREVGPLVERVQICLAQYCKRRLWKFLSDLRHDRVWFFGLYQEPPKMVHLGTCCKVTQSDLLAAQCGQTPNLDFTVHDYLPPCIPILPSNATDAGALDQVYDAKSLEYTNAYDGILLVNPATMFAVRLSYPDVVFLTPLLKERMTVTEFLTTRFIESTVMEVSRTQMDRMSRRWWGTQVSEFVDTFFSHSHTHLIQQIYWQVDTMSHWITAWMEYIGSLCWDEWNQLDVDLQRLYVLLDYAGEDVGNTANWSRILRHPKYCDWVSKMVVITLNQSF
jgi:hypothetical protein